ncbi:MAG: ferrochelatase [Thermoplasmata archaeon]
MDGTRGRVGVLLMGYGSPSGPEDLPGYLTEVMHGRRPSEDTVAEYVRRYERIGTSPQARILRSLRERLEARLAATGRDWPVYLGMKHWTPRIAEVVEQARREGIRRLIAVPLSPYDALWIMEPYRAGIEEARRATDGAVAIDLRPGWHLDPHWIGYWAREIGSTLARVGDPTAAVLISAHSLPQRFRDRGDPYPELVRATADAVAAAAGLERWAFTYQSPGNTTEPWLGPLIEEVAAHWQARGARSVVLASTGFVFDHLETLYDLDVVAREGLEGRGIRYHRVPQPNDAPEIVEALAARVETPPPAAVS